jgi:hypothetical protein
MGARRILALATMSGLVACNILTGSTALSVENGADDAAVPRVISDASPSPIETIAPEAGTADVFAEAAIDAGPQNIGTFGNHRYEVVLVGAPIDWPTAKSKAEAKGGHLATLTSKPEDKFVTNLAINAGAWTPDGYGPWLGGFKGPVATPADSGPPDPSLGWVWVTNESWSYTNWDNGQPDNDDGNEAYLGFLGDPTAGAWNDYRPDADGNISSYVIEYESL